jgi:hypothetical protein
MTTLNMTIPPFYWDSIKRLALALTLRPKYYGAAGLGEPEEHWYEGWRLIGDMKSLREIRVYIYDRYASRVPAADEDELLGHIAKVLNTPSLVVIVAVSWLLDEECDKGTEWPFPLKRGIKGRTARLKM